MIRERTEWNGPILYSYCASTPTRTYVNEMILNYVCSCVIIFFFSYKCCSLLARKFISFNAITCLEIFSALHLSVCCALCTTRKSSFQHGDTVKLQNQYFDDAQNIANRPPVIIFFLFHRCWKSFMLL